LTLLIIAGHHRSGTSLLGQLLASSGLFLGDRLMAATPSNPYGHFEDLDVVRLHDRILHDHGLTWQVDEPFIPTVPDDIRAEITDFADRRSAEHAVWGFKDPRVCLFLPLWKHLIPEAKILITVRHPTSCTESLERRQVRDLLERRGDGEMGWRFWTEPDHGLRLWNVYNSALRRCSLAYPDDCLLTTFDQVRDGRPVVAEINRRWGLGLTETETLSVFDASVVTAHPSITESTDAHLAVSTEALWLELNQMARQDTAERSTA